MAKINTKLETAKLEQLVKILKMIDSVQRFLDEERKYLNVSPSAGMLTKWLFESKSEWLERYQFKLKVKDRLAQYYSNKLFSLYMNSEVVFATKESEKPLGVFVESNQIVSEFFESINKITADYKVAHGIIE